MGCAICAAPEFPFQRHSKLDGRSRRQSEQHLCL